eukprot:tig00020614_g12140.t1
MYGQQQQYGRPTGGYAPPPPGSPADYGVGFGAGRTSYGRDSSGQDVYSRDEVRAGLNKKPASECCGCIPFGSDDSREDPAFSSYGQRQGGAFSRPGRGPPPPPPDLSRGPSAIIPPARADSNSTPTLELEGAPKGWENRARRRRTTVTSESLQAEDAARYKAPRYPKAAQDVERITSVLGKNVLFLHLREEQRDVVVGAMFEVRKSAGEIIIRQGDQGDYFYIVEQGICDVFVSTDGQQPRHVLECGPGKSFGELALMYNAPRAATVVARSEVRLWALDRLTFKLILMQSTVQQRSLLSGFVEKVPLLANLSKAERLQVVDALEEREVEAGAVVIAQGDPGDEFYIVEKGELVALQSPDPSSRPVEVGRLKAGDYFGEMALLHDRPRAATVQATTKCRILAMQRDTFTRLMGPVSDYMNRRATAYQKASAASGSDDGIVGVFKRLFN